VSAGGAKPKPKKKHGLSQSMTMERMHAIRGMTGLSRSLLSAPRSLQEIDAIIHERDVRTRCVLWRLCVFGSPVSIVIPAVRSQSLRASLMRMTKVMHRVKAVQMNAVQRRVSESGDASDDGPAPHTGLQVALSPVAFQAPSGVSAVHADIASELNFLREKVAAVLVQKAELEASVVALFEEQQQRSMSAGNPSSAFSEGRGAVHAHTVFVETCVLCAVERRVAKL
jgi:hypothetical protein